MKNLEQLNFLFLIIYYDMYIIETKIKKNIGGEGFKMAKYACKFKIVERTSSSRQNKERRSNIIM